jgi:hypothetical protein
MSKTNEAKFEFPRLSLKEFSNAIATICMKNDHKDRFFPVMDHVFTCKDCYDECHEYPDRFKFYEIKTSSEEKWLKLYPILRNIDSNLRYIADEIGKVNLIRELHRATNQFVEEEDNLEIKDL